MRPTTEELIAKYGKPDGSGEGVPSNRRKSMWAFAVLSTYRTQVAPSVSLEFDADWQGSDCEEVRSDLVADLLHLATFQGIDADYVMDRAMLHFTAEAGRGYGA